MNAQIAFPTHWLRSPREADAADGPEGRKAGARFSFPAKPAQLMQAKSRVRGFSAPALALALGFHCLVLLGVWLGARYSPPTFEEARYTGLVALWSGGAAKGGEPGRKSGGGAAGAGPAAAAEAAPPAAPAEPEARTSAPEPASAEAAPVVSKDAIPLAGKVEPKPVQKETPAETKPKPAAKAAAPEPRARPKPQKTAGEKATTSAPAGAGSAAASSERPGSGPGADTGAGNDGAQADAEGRSGSGGGEDPRPRGGVSNPKPAYPPLARQRGQEGEVLIRVGVDAEGRVIGVSLAKSSGFTLLDNAALKGVARWRFEPARRGGRPVPGEVLVPVRFRLE